MIWLLACASPETDTPPPSGTWRAGGRVVTLADGVLAVDGAPLAAGRADRVALHDGHVAFVAPANGLASVWVAEVGGEPRQLTNVGLAPAKGRAPAGWVPPPHDGAPRFDGDWLRWRSPRGEEAVRWR
ncbi:MAG: hypothetical protein ACOZNI_00305 [Myxococcota bacterium]